MATSSGVYKFSFRQGYKKPLLQPRPNVATTLSQRRCASWERLKESDLAELKKEAYYMQLFSHRCVPHLIGVQTQIKPYSLIMEFLGNETMSMTVHRLLFDFKFNEQKLLMSIAN